MDQGIEWFDYEVPRRLVAQEPLRNRADARLMVVHRSRGEIEHSHIRDLPQLIAAGDRVVLNDTKVVPARLIGQRVPSGGRWQGLYLDSTADGKWRILCKTRGRLSPGDLVRLVDRDGRPDGKLWLLEQLPEGRWLAHFEGDQPVEDVLERYGRVPLPPYIRGGNMVDADVANYQTVFARRPGAVAAPTAGLHLTKDVLRAFGERNIGVTAVTLHIGLGTFRPIEADQLDAHHMHSERGEISAQAAAEMNDTRSKGGRLLAVGTTVTRLLETAARSKSELNEAERTSGAVPAWQGETDLFIRAPFEFRAVDMLLTNFHFPRTTLLVLVQTFAGADLIRNAYETAIREEYRFFSYGDAMLIL